MIKCIPSIKRIATNGSDGLSRYKWQCEGGIVSKKYNFTIFNLQKCATKMQSFILFLIVSYHHLPMSPAELSSGFFSLSRKKKTTFFCVFAIFGPSLFQKLRRKQFDYMLKIVIFCSYIVSFLEYMISKIKKYHSSDCLA